MIVNVSLVQQKQLQVQVSMCDARGYLPPHLFCEGAVFGPPVKNWGSIEDKESGPSIKNWESRPPIDDKESGTPVKNWEFRTPIEDKESVTPIKNMKFGPPIENEDQRSFRSEQNTVKPAPGYCEEENDGDEAKTEGENGVCKANRED